MYATPYIFFTGNCAEALSHYEKALGAQVMTRMTYDQAPPPAGGGCPDGVSDMKGKIMHAHMVVGNTSIMAADCPPAMITGKPACFAITLAVDTVATAENVFAALVEGGTTDMALTKTFFAERFGSLHDRFGIPWMIICERSL